MQWTRHGVNLQQTITKFHCKRMSCSLGQELCRSRRWRGGALPCRRMKEGAHWIWDLSDPWQRVGGAAPSCTGGGTAPGPTTARRRRGGALPCLHTQKGGWGLTGPNEVNFRGEESLCERPEAKRVYVSDRYDTVAM
jgi:hypothetical protein